VSRMAERAAAWLERHALFARTVTLKVRYNDFTTITRSHSEKPATRDAERLIARALTLLERTDAGTRPVRLLGVSVHGLCEDAGDPPIPRRVGSPKLPFDQPA
jgi:DNA polymerase-4